MNPTQWGHVARCAEARARLYRKAALATQAQTGDPMAALPALVQLHREYGSGDAARAIAIRLAALEEAPRADSERSEEAR